MIVDVLNDEPFRQRYRFARDGDVLRIDIWTDPGGGVLAEHFHPTLEERYEVVTGEVTVHLDGRPHVLGPGERAVVPRGARHWFENTGAEESHLVVEADPAEFLRESIEDGVALGTRPDISAQGKPKSLSALLAAAALAHRYRDTVVLTSPPPFIQRLLFPVLARFHRS